jgi:lipopolysaccharide biosynthesis glycosyltransferase
MKTNKTVPVFFVVDDNYVAVLHVALQSLRSFASTKNTYNIHILTSGLTKKHTESFSAFNAPNFHVHVENLTSAIAGRENILQSDHFPIATYFRMFIPKHFPQYDKVICLDDDLVLNADIAELYDTDLGDNYVAGYAKNAPFKNEHISGDNPKNAFWEYAEKFIGVSIYEYVNNGVLVMNTKILREIDLEGRVFEILKKAPQIKEFDCEQGCFNYICKGKSLFLPRAWNYIPNNVPLPLDAVKLIHYSLARKPWQGADIQYADIFWKHAKGTAFYNDLVAMKKGTTNDEGAQERMKSLFQSAAKCASGKSLAECLKN